MQLFEDLHRKFLIIPLVIVGCLLAVTFCTIFGITFYSTMNEVNETVEKASAGIATTNPLKNPPIDKIIYIYNVNNEIKFFNFDTYSETEREQIIENVLSSNKTNITIDDKRFAIRRRKFTDSVKNVDIIAYTVYEYTQQFNTIKTLGSTLIVVYTLSLLAIAGLSYILAYNATKPVRIAFEKEKELIANASHELKTPLTIIQTNLSLLESEPNSTILENKKWIDSSTLQLNRMNEMIIQMLELSKFEDPNKKVNKEVINLSELCEGLLLSFDALCFEKGISFKTTIQPNILLECDRVETEKMITTLADNALKYTNVNGQIDVVLSATNKTISYKITNTGPGIPHEKISKIFDRFYKVDESHKENGNSYGLGLSIAKSIANSLGGDIKCTSEIDKYTTFEVTLPRKKLSLSV